MPKLKHSHGTTFYLAKGRASAPTIVALHGGPGGTHANLKGLFELTKLSTRVVLYDQLGGGQSSKTSKAKWTIEIFVQELDTLIEKLRLGKVILYSASWGTTLALEYYLAHPDKIAAIVFQSPLFCTADWQRDAIKLMKKMEEPDRTILLANVRGKMGDKDELQRAFHSYYLHYVLRDQKKLTAIFATKNPNGAKIYNYMWGPSEFYATGTLKGYDRRHFLKAINVPVQIICGEYDEATPATGKRYAESMQNAEFAVVKGGSHVLMLEQPGALTKIVKKFVKKVLKDWQFT